MSGWSESLSPKGRKGANQLKNKLTGLLEKLWTLGNTNATYIHSTYNVQWLPVCVRLTPINTWSVVTHLLTEELLTPFMDDDQAWLEKQRYLFVVVVVSYEDNIMFDLE